MNPLISIIIPVYNTEPYLDNCIKSVLNQSYENLEVILVNDGSTDKSGVICDEFAKKDRRIKVIHKENGGVSSARNLALGICSGEYVGFVDSDDTIEPNMYEVLLKQLVENDADVAICNFAWVYSNRLIKNENNTVEVFGADEAIRLSLIGEKFSGQACNKLFKKSIVDNIVFNEGIYIYEDLLFLIQCLLKSKKTVYTSVCLYNYYMRESSAYNRQFTKKQWTAYNACIEVEKHLKKSSDYIRNKPYIDTLFLNCNLYFYQQMVFSKNCRKEYLKTIRNNLKSRLNKDSYRLLNKRSRLQIIIIRLSFHAFCMYYRLLMMRSRRG